MAGDEFSIALFLRWCLIHEELNTAQLELKRSETNGKADERDNAGTVVGGIFLNRKRWTVPLVDGTAELCCPSSCTFE